LPGGTASNVVCLIARADVALSVVMTTVSTLAAVLLTPLLTGLLAGRYVPVDGWKLLLDVLQVVLLPLALGVALRRGAPRLSRRLAPVMPPVAVLAIVWIVASIVGSQRQVLLEQGALLLLAALLLHGGGFLLGWLLPAALHQPPPVRRTVSIEVGMQNSGLAVVLARSGFAASPLTALPGRSRRWCMRCWAACWPVGGGAAAEPGLVIIDGFSFYVQVFPFSWWRNPREGSGRWMAAVRWGAFWAEASTVFGLERGSKFLNPVGVTIGIKRKANADLL
jgi:hypothetical protein